MKIVGLPINKASITDEFRMLVDDTASRVFISSVGFYPEHPERTNDYLCAPAGFDYLLDAGYKFEWPNAVDFTQYQRTVIMCPVWYTPDRVRRSPKQVADNIIQIANVVKSYGIHDVCYKTQGSPLVYDSVVPYLLNNVTAVIDTLSSPQLVYSALGRYAPLPLKIVNVREESVASGYTNVIGCLGSIYGGLGAKNGFLEALEQASRVWAVRVAETPDIEELTPSDVVQEIMAGGKRFNARTVAVEIL